WSAHPSHRRPSSTNVSPTSNTTTRIRIAVCSPRLVAGERQAMHDAAEAVEVVDGVVQCAAIVPHGKRADLPVEAAGELGPRLVPVEEVEDRRALLFRHVLEAQGVGDIDVERLAPGLGMGAHHRVLADILL